MRKLFLLALLATPIWGTAAAVQKKECHNAGSTQSVSCTFDSAVTAGNQIIVGIVGGGNWRITGVTDNCSNGSSSYSQDVYRLRPNPEASIYRAVNVSGGTCTVTASSSGSGGTYGTVFIVEYSGLDNSATSPDATASQIDSGDTQTLLAGTLTTTNATDLIVMVGNSNTGSNPAGYSAGSGYTLQLSQGDGSCCQSAGFEDQVVSSTGPYSPSMTITGSASTFAAVSAAYKISGGGGGGGDGGGGVYRRPITINQSKVSGSDQSNFPVLVSLSDSTLKTVANGGHVQNANGYDICFYADPGRSSPLYWEVESYNASAGTLLAWVKVPTLSHTSDTVIYVFYGDPAINTFQSTASAVWDATFKAVWHLPDGTTLTANDSTSNANNGAITAATASAGKVDGGGNMDGSTAYIDMGAGVSSLSPTSAYTAEAWFNPNASSQSAWAHILIRDYSNPRGDPWIGYEIDANASGTTGHYGAVTATGGTVHVIDSGVSVSAGVAVHLVLTYDNGTSNPTLYINGSQVGSVSASGSVSYAGTGRFRIGANSAGGEIANGVVDEVRISNIARSAGWIATEYNNQSSPGTFYALGSETALAAAARRRIIN